MYKTPGYLLDILRPPTLLKMPFGRMKAFFFKKLCFLIILSNFSNFKLSLIFAKKKNIFFAKKKTKKSLKNIFKKKPFETRSRKNLPHVAILKNFQDFFQKQTFIFFQKNPNFELLTIPVAFHGNFAKIY